MTMRAVQARAGGPRVAIVAGLRTPFVKSGTAFRDLSALDLAKRVVSELVSRVELDPAEIDRLIYGQVVPSVDVANIAREVVLGSSLPSTVDAYSVARACATSTQAVADGAAAIWLGEADVVLAGGVDSLSKPPMSYGDRLVSSLMEASAAKDPMSKAKVFLDLRPKDLLPKVPAIKEQATGLSMGESAEKMAKENGIARADQDAFALRSHQRASHAWERGIFRDEVMTVYAGERYEHPVSRDGIVRKDTSLERLGQLRSVFDREHGSITAGNSSPLTDGASAVLLMSEARARALGLEPLAFVRGYAFATVDPAWQLLMAPCFAVPRLLDLTGLALADMSLVDMHEAFAAQVLSNTQALASPAWAKEHLGRDQAVGEINPDILNIYGGSIALGHPFAATGARQIHTVARELARRGAGKALISQCAAGGLGAAMILERD